MVSFATWRQLQAASGMGFLLFVVLHFLSHYATIASWNTGLVMLLKVRGVYQRPVIELLVFASLILHVVANTNVYMKRTAMEKSGKMKKKDEDGDTSQTKKSVASKELPGSMELNAHRITGLMLTVLTVGHVLATRAVPLYALDDPTQYDYSVMYLEAQHLPKHLFATYLCLFGMAANWHSVYGAWSAISTLRGQSVRGKPFPFVLKPVALLLHVLIIFAVLSIAGYRYSVDVSDKSQHVFEAVEAVKKFRKA